MYNNSYYDMNDEGTCLSHRRVWRLSVRSTQSADPCRSFHPSAPVQRCSIGSVKPLQLTHTGRRCTAGDRAIIPTSSVTDPEPRR